MSETEPAMTPEQWAEEFAEEFPGKWRPVREGQVFIDPKYGLSAAYDAGCASVTLNDPHAAAAVCLHDQPFGFTWEDVEDLRLLAEAYSTARVKARSAVDEEVVEAMQKYVEHTGNRWLDLADRIAALLPPREDEDG